MIRLSIFRCIVVGLVPFLIGAWPNQSSSQSPDTYLKITSIEDFTGIVSESREGLYRVQLPPADKDLFWRFEEGEVRLGYFDYWWNARRIDHGMFTRLCEDFADDTLAHLKGRIDEKKEVSKADPFETYTYFYFDDGRFGIQRNLMVKKRFYSVLAVFSSLLNRHKFERVLKSLEATGEADIEKIMQKRIADRTLSALPQSPVAIGEASDAVDEHLKGKVAKIVEEDESGVAEAKDLRFVSRIIEFDTRGYVVKKIETGNYGNPDWVEIWGFVDGKRVSKVGFSYDRYSLFDRIIGAPLVEGPNIPKPELGYDPRYYISYKKVYRSGKLVEQIHYDNSGRITFRKSFSYLGNRVTATAYGSTNDLRFKTVVTLDKKSLPVEEIYYPPPQNNTLPYRTTFEYVFDSQGNWTRKTVYGSTDGRPSYYVHRTITYF